MNIKHKIAKNTVANLAGRGAQIAIALITTPLLIKYLGIELYGVWVILSAITNYYGLFDFGLGSTYVKYVAEYKAKEDWISLRNTIATGFYFSVIIGAAILFLGRLFEGALLGLFVKGYENIPGIRDIYLGTLALFCLAYLGQFFQSILDGYQRMELKNISLVVQRAINLLLIIAFLVAGYGLFGLVIAGLVSWLVLIVVNYVQARALFPQLSLQPRHISAGDFRILMSFGWKVQITQFAVWTLNNADKLFLGYFTTPAAVSVYDIAYKLRNFSREPVIAYINTITPAASEIFAHGNIDRIRDFYIKCSRYLVFLTFPLCAFMVVNAYGIVRAWVGSGFEEAALILQILMVGNICNLMTGCGTQIARGINRPELETKYTVWVTVLTLAFGYIFTKKYGILGLSAGSSLALGAPSLAFLFIFNDHVKLALGAFFKMIIKGPLVLLFAVMCGDVFLSLVFHDIPAPAAVVLPVKLALYVLVFFIVLKGTIRRSAVL